MENPSSWGPLEHAISAAFDEWYKEKQQGVYGNSLVMRIANCVRQQQERFPPTEDAWTQLGGGLVARMLNGNLELVCKTSSSMPVRLDSNMTNALLTFITRSRVTDEP